MSRTATRTVEPLIYGVDATRFRDSDGDGIGDLRGVQDRLDYVAELGASWLWLLPFYPSARRDNGYDIDDHRAVDPRVGTVEDLRDLVAASHRRGIKVLIDLVVHHTSDRHPWFERARNDALSAYRDYYVWSNRPLSRAGDDPVFPREEQAVWAYDQTAGAWFHHSYYSFQPDLNLANERVIDEVLGIAERWARLGVDGFRIDGATRFVGEVDGRVVDVPAGPLLDRVRERLDLVAPGTQLIGEADASVESLAELTEGRRFDRVLNFALANRIYLALARADAGMLQGAMAELAERLPTRHWVNFMRNADDLEQGGELPVMGDERRLRMTLSLLAALPGTPLLLYGQELGTGDELSASGRSTVRLTMPWSDDADGGFSVNIVPGTVATARSRRGVRHANARAQRGDPRSVLALTRRLIDLRRGLSDDDEIRATRSDDAPTVLVLRGRRHVIVHNLGAHPVRSPHLPRGVPSLAERYGDGEIGPYGFAWIVRDARPIDHPARQGSRRGTPGGLRGRRIREQQKGRS